MTLFISTTPHPPTLNVKWPPITPDEALAQRGPQIPDLMFKVVNDLIVRKLHHDTAYISETEIIAEFLVSAGSTWSREVIYQQRALDFEQFYRRAGWIVTYDKPAHNENYPAIFIFRRKL